MGNAWMRNAWFHPMRAIHSFTRKVAQLEQIKYHALTPEENVTEKSCCMATEILRLAK